MSFNVASNVIAMRAFRPARAVRRSERSNTFVARLLPAILLTSGTLPTAVAVPRPEGFAEPVARWGEWARSHL
jgi:hypothetical protein